MLNLKRFTLPLQAAAVTAACLAVGWFAAGCAATPEGQDQLQQGYDDLERRQYDAAIGKADAFLASNTSGGAGSAEALYLRGRALEQKVAANPHESGQNLQSARSAYIDALKHDPSPQLEAHIRASLANVAYFQDDYQTALNQWGSAYDKLESPDSRAWVLYRIGLSHQRMGRFDEADKSFAAVQKQYPNTIPAQRAREHAGATGFFVQLGTFNSAAGADRATATIREQGMAPVRLTDTKGRHLLRVGPFRSYAQAQAIKRKFSGTYSDAMIIP
jgi:tetratricopeptide (TPR) repeat protein